jgi:hypothetical protein
LTFENLNFKFTLEILDLRVKLNILSSEGFDLLALLIKLLLVGKHHLLDSEYLICLLLQSLFKLLLDLSSQSYLVIFDFFDSLMLLREILEILFGHFIPLLAELKLSLINLFLMNSLHLLYLVGMTCNQITFLLLKILIFAISLIDLMLKGSNLNCMLSFEIFPFLLLFFGKKVMGTSLGLELTLFVSKLLGKAFSLLQKNIMCLLKLCEIILNLSSLRISL